MGAARVLGLDSLLPLPGILVQLHLLLDRGGSVSASRTGVAPGSWRGSHRVCYWPMLAR